jgi:hypothetical protein
LNGSFFFNCQYDWMGVSSRKGLYDAHIVMSWRQDRIPKRPQGVPSTSIEYDNDKHDIVEKASHIRD